MNENTISLVVQVIAAALQLLPVATSTVIGVKQLLAADPAMPEALRKILQDTADDNAATLSLVQKWMDSHPE